MKRTALISTLIASLDAFLSKHLRMLPKLGSDTWLLILLVLVACISLGVFLTYAFLFAHAAAFAAI